MASEDLGSLLWRIHLVVDVVGDGTEPRELARQFLAGRRPDARVVDLIPDLVAHPSMPPKPEAAPLPSAQAVYVVMDAPSASGGPGHAAVAFHRPAFLWARQVYTDPRPTNMGWGPQEMPEFDRIEFGGQAHHYGWTTAPTPAAAVMRATELVEEQETDR